MLLSSPSGAESSRTAPDRGTEVDHSCFSVRYVIYLVANNVELWAGFHEADRHRFISSAVLLSVVYSEGRVASQTRLNGLTPRSTGGICNRCKVTLWEPKGNTIDNVAEFRFNLEY